MLFARLEFDAPLAKVVLSHPDGNRINFAGREELLDSFERIARQHGACRYREWRASISAEAAISRTAGDADVLTPRVEVSDNAFDSGAQMIARRPDKTSKL